MISVIVPALNEAEEIEATLRSLASQSLGRENFDIVVVDVGSDYARYRSFKFTTPSGLQHVD